LRLPHQPHPARGRRALPARDRPQRRRRAVSEATAQRIVHFTSEMTPLAKVGGLGDVVGALSREQARRGHALILAIRAYRSVAFASGWTRTRRGAREGPGGLGREPAGFEILAPPATDGATDGAPESGSYRVLRVEHLGERRFFDRDGIYDDALRGQ